MAYRTVHRSKTYGISCVLPLSFALLACGEQDEALPNSTLKQTLEGTLSKVIVDGHGPNSGAHYFLKVDDSRRVHELSFDMPPALVTGAKLSVEGFHLESRFHVTNYNKSERALEPLGTVALPLTDGALLKTRTVGVITVDMNEDGMNDMTNDLLRQLVLDPDNPGPLLGVGPTDKSARQFYAENSYGGYRLRGAAEGPIPWDGSACVGGVEDAAYVLRDELSSTYDSYVWYFGSVDEDCGYAWGEEGTWNNPAQNTWFNGRFDANVFSHELGHNIGLMHASTLSCGDVPLAEDPLSCKSDEYGNRYSVMGTGGIRHLNAIEKWYLTWFGGCNGVKVRQSGTFTLLPIEKACNGIQALQIPMPKADRTFFTDQSEEPTELKYYYLELRTSQKMDTGMTPQVLVHVSDRIQPPDKVSARTALIDMNPTTSEFDGLLAEQSYTDPAGDLTFRVDSLDNDKAMVTVTMASNNAVTTCMDGAVLVGPGPDTCDEPFVASGTGGTYGYHVGPQRIDAGYDYYRNANGGGATASNNATFGGDAANALGTQTSVSGTDGKIAHFEDPTSCGCRIGGPKTDVSRAFGWFTATVLLTLAAMRRRQY